jgi:CHRD domain
MRTRAILSVFVLGLIAVGVAAGSMNGRWHTHATGDNEVPPNASLAQGQANLKLSDDGTSLSFKLNVANIENVTQAHIHMAPAGTNGGIVAWLYPSAPPLQLIPGRSSGTLGEGTITAASLTGPLAGQPLSALVAAIEAGNAYVNVHTTQFPPGEVRGQLR